MGKLIITGISHDTLSVYSWVSRNYLNIIISKTHLKMIHECSSLVYEYFTAVINSWVLPQQIMNIQFCCLSFCMLILVKYPNDIFINSDLVIHIWWILHPCPFFAVSSIISSICALPTPHWRCQNVQLIISVTKTFMIRNVFKTLL